MLPSTWHSQWSKKPLGTTLFLKTFEFFEHIFVNLCVKKSFRKTTNGHLLPFVAMLEFHDLENMHSVIALCSLFLGLCGLCSTVLCLSLCCAKTEELVPRLMGWLGDKLIHVPYCVKMFTRCSYPLLFMKCQPLLCL